MILKEIMEKVEETHKGLGRFFMINLIGSKAKMAVINIGSAGTGKSAVTNSVAKQYKDQSRKFDSVTRSGLKHIQADLNNFDGVVVIDDLGKIDTQYSRIATISTFVELCYSHFIEKMTMSLHIKIGNYNGSALMNTQPVIMKMVVNSPEWDAVIRDKTLRYYHFIRPTDPVTFYPQVTLPPGGNPEKVKLTGLHGKAMKGLMNISRYHWSKARANEHLKSLLKATAALDLEKKVNNDHVKFLFNILKPIRAERFLLYRHELEGNQSFLVNLHCLLTEMLSYEPLTLTDLQQDYNISKTTAYRILGDMKGYCYIDKTNGMEIKSTNVMEHIIEEVK